MARKKVDVQFQTVVQTNEQWDEMLVGDGLKVVDIYSAWCGPCKSIASILRKVRNEIGDDLLHFAVAESDNIDRLTMYRNKSQPTFLFYGGDTLVSIVRGANVPLLIQQIHEQLGREHQALRYGLQRVEVIDLEIQRVEEEKRAEEERKQYEIELEKRKVPKEVTIAMIKPDAVQEGKLEEIIEKITAAGIEILKQEIKMLNIEEAAEFYKEYEEAEYFEQLIEYMTSGPCCVLILSNDGVGDGIIDDWKAIIGPPEAADEKEQFPDAWRAEYGSSARTNALHGSDSLDSAARELAFFFPDFAVPKVLRSRPETEERPSSRLQRTLALIRPETSEATKNEILKAIDNGGFTIALQKEIELTREEAEDFYKEHKSKDYYENLIKKMTSGPLIALGLARQDSVNAWRDMIGPPDVKLAKEFVPSSIRARFSSDDINVVHGSENAESADKELEFFFPEQRKVVEKTLAVIKPDAMERKDSIIEEIEKAGFHIAMKEETILTKELAEKFYIEHEGKDFFDSLTSFISSGPTLFMILEKEDAIRSWRKMIGPNDPDLARKEAPETLRAVFGSDIVSNALHGSISYEEALEKLAIIFGNAAKQALKVGTEDEGYGDDFEEEVKSQGEPEGKDDDQNMTTDGEATETGDENKNDGDNAEGVDAPDALEVEEKKELEEIVEETADEQVTIQNDEVKEQDTSKSLKEDENADEVSKVEEVDEESNKEVEHIDTENQDKNETENAATVDELQEVTEEAPATTEEITETPAEEKPNEEADGNKIETTDDKRDETPSAIDEDKTVELSEEKPTEAATEQKVEEVAEAVEQPPESTTEKAEEVTKETPQEDAKEVAEEAPVEEKPKDETAGDVDDNIPEEKLTE